MPFKTRQTIDEMKTIIHTLKIRYFLAFTEEEPVLLPNDELFVSDEMVKIFAHGFIIGKTNDAVNSNLIFYN